ncbi:unnamed protein product [Prorocentrum cordatum]|uniref:PPPDE domain-containing protein n=1 Tax=Prorocentrum cordatum TaxID=2364126 RepID=A0ABN9RNF5_9DINO|nr:unnamed protein product [Polarella glacialis]
MPPTSGEPRAALRGQRRRAPGQGSRVQLAVTALGGLPGAQVYHSSVLVEGLEFSFGAMPGLTMASGAASHAAVGGSPRVFELGFSERTARQLATALGPYFKRGTYDLLRKNCNTFSDCAIFFLLGQRLDSKFRSLDQLGASIPGVVQMGSFGFYRPNRAADSFDVEVLIQSIGRRSKGAGLGVGSKAAAPAENLWERAEQLVQAAGNLWGGCAQLPGQRAASLEPERLGERLRTKEAARAHDATFRVGGA